ncbi:MAG: methyl-accepting chemotaxis protein [Bdellovibrio sp.]|nr:methyl-accepting chemotaxis protein [Bdellovibrio sp.]
MAGDPNAPSVIYLEETRKELLSMLILMEVVFLSMAFIISIFLSHRVAGPLYKLDRYFREARDGNIEQKLFFRKNDYFKELPDHYNDMMDAIRMRLGQGDSSKAAQTISQVLPVIEKAAGRVDAQTRIELESVLTVLRNTLKN